MPADISSSAAGGAPPTPAPNRSAGTSSAREALTTPAVASSDDDSPLSTFWELGPSNRRGTFVLRIYRPNYVLPLHVTSDIGTPASPSHPAEPATVPYRRVEAKLQISLRAKVAEDVFHSGGDLWFAYTQRSLWQLWNPDQSSPFRSNDYQPEGIFLLPVPERWRVLPGDWRWRFAQLGLAHQSNGQGGSLSRSWNRIDLGTAIERGAFALQLRMHERVFRSRRRDDNPDIVEQLGRYELQATWAHGLAIASATWRTNLRTLSGRSLQLDWTYPVLRDQPDGLRWYVQLYTGTGETLIDYNHEQTSLGLGVSLFRF